MISSGCQRRVLDKHDLNSFVKLLFDSYRIIGPVITECGDRFLELADPNMLDLDFSNSRLSPKHVFFPQTETLFSFDTRNDIREIKEEKECGDDKRSILLGVRPCDAAAIHCLDGIFKGNDFRDPYYTKKRDTTSIIGFSCTHPAPTCFCTSVGCGPDSHTGCDILFFDLSDRYYMEVYTPSGEEIIQQTNTLLRQATHEDQGAKEELVKSVRQAINRIFSVDGLKEKLDDFEASYWQQLHHKCLGCGICTYFCPTCHCFDITDDHHGSCGRRIRTWDSCMFASFTQHASGHNPRPTQKERMRQRIMHKFNYAVKNNGCLFCVGCGRCITYCPVNLDVRYVLAGILEAS